MSCVRPRVCPFAMLFQRYLSYAMMDFQVPFICGAFWDKDGLFGFWHQKAKGQSLSVTEGSADRGIQSSMLELCSNRLFWRLVRPAFQSDLLAIV